VTVGRRAQQRRSRARRRVALVDPRGSGANTVAHLLAPEEVHLEPDDPWGWAVAELGLTREAFWIERSRPGWGQLLDQFAAAQVLEETPPDAMGRGGGRGPVWETPIVDGAPPRPLELVAVWRPHPVLGFDLGYRILADGFLALWFLPRSEGRGALEALRHYLGQVEVRAFQHLRRAAWTVTANARHRLLLERLSLGADTSWLGAELVEELDRQLVRPLELRSRAPAALTAVPNRIILRDVDDGGATATSSFLLPHAPVFQLPPRFAGSSRFTDVSLRLGPHYLVVDHGDGVLTLELRGLS
jgi:hypothetical protein